MLPVFFSFQTQISQIHFRREAFFLFHFSIIRLFFSFSRLLFFILLATKTLVQLPNFLRFNFPTFFFNFLSRLNNLNYFIFLTCNFNISLVASKKNFSDAQVVVASEANSNEIRNHPRTTTRMFKIPPTKLTRQRVFFSFHV